MRRRRIKNEKAVLGLRAVGTTDGTQSPTPGWCDEKNHRAARVGNAVL